MCYIPKIFLRIFLYLFDVMGAKIVNQLVKPLLVFGAVLCGKLFHCFAKLIV